MPPTVEELAAKIEELQKANTALTTKVEAQEALIQGHKTEIGAARQEFQDNIKKIEAAGGDAENQKKLVDRLEALEQNPALKTKVSNDPQGGTKAKKTIKELKESCTPEQREAADKAFQKLNPEQRIALLGDDALFEKFISAAHEAVPSVPASLFGDENTDEGAKANEFRKLFNLSDKESSHVPGAGNNRRGPSRFADATPNKGGDGSEPQPVRRLPGGRIPRPSQDQ